MDHLFLQVFITFVSILLLLYILVFGHEACEILTPQPGIKHTPPALGRQIFSHWTTREIPSSVILNSLGVAELPPFRHLSVSVGEAGGGPFLPTGAIVEGLIGEEDRRPSLGQGLRS